MTLFLCQTTENSPHQHPWDLCVHENPRHSVWNHEFSNQTSPPRTSRFPGAHPRKFAGDWRLRIKCFSSSSGTSASRPEQLDLVVHLVLQILLVARHVGLPAIGTRLEFQKRAPSRRNDRAQKLLFPSSFCRIISPLQSPPCLQRLLPRHVDNVIRLSHERCMHLLQHKLQVLHSSVLVRVRRQQLEINCCRRDFRRRSSCTLQHHLGLQDHQQRNPSFSSTTVGNPLPCQTIPSDDQGH